MVFDDIVIGSGLSALGVVLGLGSERNILMLGGPRRGESVYYRQDRAVPCAHLGLGGLGNFWHGVIPMALRASFDEVRDCDFVRMFDKFYPRTSVKDHLRRQQLFVPWRPIRPVAELRRLRRASAERLTIHPQTAERFNWRNSEISVDTVDGVQYRGRRLWIAAGSLNTPGLLERSLGRGYSRGCVSDHVLCYVGLLAAELRRTVSRTRDGVFFPAHYDVEGKSLYTLRPARFGFRTLDYGIEQRAVFGMPTGSAIAKIMRRMSPGLLAEAFYNRTGIFANADCYSVYAQTPVQDAYVLQNGKLPIVACSARILRAAAESRDRVPFKGVRRSQRADLHVPGIHLHHSIESDSLVAHGIDQPGSPIQIVDASTVSDIGPEHHSFKVMLRAYARGRQATTMIQ